MARHHRITGTILHVIVRGNGKQILFEDRADYEYYLSLLKKYRDETGLILLAYCLMDNHVHLLIQDPERQISLFMQKTGICYAKYYNQKYERIGHVFQDRFKSETVTSDEYLLKAYRYILKNPEHAGIALVSLYPWNSYHEYGSSGGLTDSTLIVSKLGTIDSLNAFLAKKEETEIMESSPPVHDDEWALQIVRSTCKIPSGTALQQMPKCERDQALAQLKSKGIPVRQLERLTGINRGVIQRAKMCQTEPTPLTHLEKEDL